jgi:alanine-glyoxylate transaminase / serine-glyoxylate transaminase / serine-pyruvate transaminase
MVVRAGREFLAIPGPTTLPDEVLRAMHRPAVDIYAGPLLALTDGLLADISRLFRTEGRSYIYIAMATAPGRHRSPMCSPRATKFWC